MDNEILQRVDKKQDRILDKLDDMSDWQRKIESGQAVNTTHIANLTKLISRNTKSIADNEKEIKAVGKTNKIISTVSATVGGVIGFVTSYFKP